MSVDMQHHSASENITSIGGNARGRIWRAIFNGMKCRCPRCGTGKLFSTYLKVEHTCPSCDLELHHQRADDAPPYFTMFIVGHILLPLVFIVERNWQPEWWVHAALWAPMSIVMTLWLLPIVKGAIIGIQWNVGMHGFDDSVCVPEPDKET